MRARSNASTLAGYFDTVALPRVQKVMFAPKWRDGEPARLPTREEIAHTPRLVKVLRLEGYEDALHNLVSEETLEREKPRALAFEATVGGDAYRLTYLARLPLAAFIVIGQLEPQPLVLQDRATTSYRVRAPANILAEIRQLLKQRRRYDADGDAPLPRLHIDRSLCNPLLLNPADFGLEVSVSPPGLGRNERDFVKDLRAFWTAHQGQDPFRHLEIHLLRNVPKVGVGFFVHSGFYPDFILWARDQRDKVTHVRFLDPHGLHHGGLVGNTNRFEALRQLKVVSQQSDFQRARIKMDGFLLVATKLEHIVDHGTRDWAVLEKEFPLIRQEGDYLRKVLDFSRP